MSTRTTTTTTTSVSTVALAALLLLVLLSCTDEQSSSLVAARLSAREVASLRALYARAGGAQWRAAANWQSTYDPCGADGFVADPVDATRVVSTRWHGVYCSVTNRGAPPPPPVFITVSPTPFEAVSPEPTPAPPTPEPTPYTPAPTPNDEPLHTVETLALSTNGLRGALDEAGLFTADENATTTASGAATIYLPSLSVLQLGASVGDEQLLAGSMAAVAQLDRLSVLDVSSNARWQSRIDDLTPLSELRVLIASETSDDNVRVNDRSLPTWVWTRLVSLHLRNTNLTGTLASWTTGNAPAALATSPLAVLDLAHNQLTGDFPSDFPVDSFPALSRVYLGDNLLGSSAAGDAAPTPAAPTPAPPADEPVVVSALPSPLRSFFARSAATQLSELSLHDNLLAGQLPQALYLALDGAFTLDLGRNRFSGILPPRPAALTPTPDATPTLPTPAGYPSPEPTPDSPPTPSIRQLDLSVNCLVGTVPASLVETLFPESILNATRDIADGALPSSSGDSSTDPSQADGWLHACALLAGNNFCCTETPLPELCVAAGLAPLPACPCASAELPPQLGDVVVVPFSAATNALIASGDTANVTITSNSSEPGAPALGTLSNFVNTTDGSSALPANSTLTVSAGDAEVSAFALESLRWASGTGGAQADCGNAKELPFYPTVLSPVVEVSLGTDGAPPTPDDKNPPLHVLENGNSVELCLLVFSPLDACGKPLLNVGAIGDGNLAGVQCLAYWDVKLLRWVCADRDLRVRKIGNGNNETGAERRRRRRRDEEAAAAGAERSQLVVPTPEAVSSQLLEQEADFVDANSDGIDDDEEGEVYLCGSTTHFTLFSVLSDPIVPAQPKSDTECNGSSSNGGDDAERHRVIYAAVIGGIVGAVVLVVIVSIVVMQRKNLGQRIGDTTEDVFALRQQMKSTSDSYAQMGDDEPIKLSGQAGRDNPFAASTATFDRATGTASPAPPTTQLEDVGQHDNPLYDDRRAYGEVV